MADERTIDALVKEFNEMLVAYSHTLGKASALTIKSQLQKWWDERAGKDGEVPASVRYDVTAFMFHYADDDKDDLYFRPFASWQDSAGNQIHLPDIKKVDENEIKHWIGRSDQINHPIMKMRYSDLVWELTQTVTGKKPDVLFARRAIEAYLNSVETELYDEQLYAIHYCERALNLSLSISDNSLIQRCVKCIFSLYGKIADYDKVGLWVFLYDDLLDNNKITLSDVEVDKIISELNVILNKFTVVIDGKHPDPWVADAASERLAKYYQRKGLLDSARQAIRQSGRYFEQVSTNVGALLAIGWLERVLDKYDKFGMTEDKERVLREMKKRGKTVKDEMKEISGEVKVSKDDMDKLIDDVCSGSPEEALSKLIFHFMPSIESAKDLCDHIKKNCVFLSFIETTLIRDGNIEARIGSVQEDEVGHLLQNMSQQISMHSAFISFVLKEIKSRNVVTTDDFLSFIKQSPLVGDGEIDILKEGIIAHFAGSYIASVHMLVPQCERLIRNMAGLIGVVTTKHKARNNTIQEKNLNDLLSDELFKKVVPENLRLYLLCFLADPRGLNVRNNVAHGLLTSGAFSEQLSGQLIYCLLLCSILRLEKKEEKPTDS